jgi:tetratricopeptide (TPR) repeat protein
MHQGISTAGNGLGIVYDKLGQYDTAYFYYNKALDAAKFSKNDYGIAMSYGNLALNSEYQGDYSAAIA